MNAREVCTSGVVLAALFAAVAAQAQEVHKCTANGTVTYQAKPCPAGDVVLPAAPMPSEQDQRQARADLSRQRYQAATGQILDRRLVPPPPPPPAQQTSTSTDYYLVTTKHGRSYLLRETTRTPVAPPPKPLNNCERLNQEYAAAEDKRVQLKVPSELASHDELLRNAEADVARLRELAQASHCNLK